MKTLMRVSLVLTTVLGGIVASGSDALSSDSSPQAPNSFAEEAGPDAELSKHRSRTQHFVPNSQAFWDNSKHWTTNWGPAYRDTVESPNNLVPCTGLYALCYHSGPEPYPCKLDRSGRFANCTCTVDKQINYVLISAILNYKVYLETIEVCGVDGSDCYLEPDKAPVCQAIRKGKLIRDADLISTFSSDAQADVADRLSNLSEVEDDVTSCPRGPYAGCMTAPCKQTRSGDAVCSCPVFYGPFQLLDSEAQCDLGGRLVNSAGYYPLLLDAGVTDGRADDVK